MQKELDENYLVTKLTYVVTGEVIDPEAVNGDIQLLTARATGIENYDDYKFIVTSDDPDLAEINAYRANIYRPMPGEAAGGGDADRHHAAQDKGRLRAEADRPQGPAADKGGA